ncbi:MAG TPA: hypothetical protein VK217_10310 [Acidimicrobiales bacterium]|nr:hypothetical protein [Acidimicrobiales bacterium]
MLVVVAVVLPGVLWLAIPRGSASAKHDPGRPRQTTTSRPRPVILPSLVSLVPELTTFPGTLAALPFPSTGQSAVFVQGVGLLGATSDEQPVPMASVTKVMTAILVLRDHPLGDGSGPTFTMTEPDHLAFIHDATNDDSNLDVVAGERLTERQLLEALMIPSADNIADYLARWDAGSISAFVQKMNAMAEALGLKHTHYADASGLNPDSQSTATDQALLGAYAMNIPGMISVEDHPTMTFPVEGTVGNFNPVVGEDGVIGLKSGFTSAAQGCLVTAARRTVGGHTVLILSSTLGQPMNLPQVGDIDLQLLDAATAALEVRPILQSGQTVAAVVAGWTQQRRTVVVTGDPATVVGWPGLRVRTVVTAAIPIPVGPQRGWPASTPVATVEVSTPGGLQCLAFGMLASDLPPAPPGWSPPPAAGSAPGSTS